jgi:uncharacterized protein YoxC
MPDLIAVVLASIPFIVFVLLIIETFRSTSSDADMFPVDLFRRSFGA